MYFGIEEMFRFIKEWWRNDAVSKRKKSESRKQKHTKAKKGR